MTIPKIPIDDAVNLNKIIHSEEFNHIYDQYMLTNESHRLKDLPDLEKRIALYIIYTGQEEYLQDMHDMLYERHMPSIEEFMKNRTYLGAYWASTYNYWKNVLKTAFDDTNSINEVIYSGAIGTGKSTIARRGFLYNVYRVCCLRYPHSVFGVTDDTPLAGVIISVTLDQVEDTTMKPLRAMIDKMPCFTRVKKMSSLSGYSSNDPIPYVYNDEKIYLPNNILIAGGSNNNHVVGYSIHSAIFDEAEEKGLEESLNLYTSIKERIRSRFLGSKFTSLSLISSSKTKTGIIWDYTKTLPEDDPYTLYLKPCIWDVKADSFGDLYSRGYFYVLVGTKTHPSRILDLERNSIEDGTFVPPSNCEVIKVPNVYRRDFEGSRIEAAVNNLAGMNTDTSQRPFDDVEGIEYDFLLPEIHLVAPLGSPQKLVNQLPKELFINTPVGLRLKRYPNVLRYCFAENTKVKLLSGISKTMKELSDDCNNGVTNYTYSWNGSNWVPGKIVFAGITTIANEKCIITLDNDKTIECTLNHKFLMRDGSYKEAQYLKEGDSLMPLYHKIEKDNILGHFNYRGYEEILNNKTNKWEFTYKVVADYFENGLQDAKSRLNVDGNKYLVRHHIDFDSQNNHPDNLVFMGDRDHMKLHANHADKCGYAASWKNSDFRKMMSKVNSRNGKINGKKFMEEHWKDPEWRRKIESNENIKKAGRENIIKWNKTESHKAGCKLRYDLGISGLSMFSEEYRKEFCKRGGLIAAKNLNKDPLMGKKKIGGIISNFIDSITDNPISKEIYESHRNSERIKNPYSPIPSFDTIVSDYLDYIKEPSKSRLLINHKVKSICTVKCNEPMYDLTIEDKFNTHNFALEAGVVVSNCHLDIAEASGGSQAGISLLHKEYQVNELGEKETVFVVDFAGYIDSPTRIDIGAIQKLYEDLVRERGVMIHTLSADQYQSSQVRQYFEVHKLAQKVELVSVDRTPDPYLDFASLIQSKRFKIGKCPYLKQQLVKLALENNKVVKTTVNKDMSDSVCGALHNALINLDDSPTYEFKDLNYNIGVKEVASLLKVTEDKVCEL